MKNWYKLVGLVAVMAVIGIALVACSDGSTDDPVLAKYQFTGDFSVNSTPTGKITIGKNSISTTTAGISLSGIYTSGGGSDGESTWTYLYTGDGTKIGVILVNSEAKEVVLGTTHLSGWGHASKIESGDMSDDYKGYGIKEL